MGKDLIITERKDIVAIANAVRNKTGESKKITLGEIVSGINSINNSGVDTSDANITSGYQMLGGVTAYGAQGKITGLIPSQGATTVTPSNSVQTAITSGTYASGDIKVAAVATETRELNSNGIYTPSTGKYFSSVTVNVPSEDFATQSKTVSPSTEQQVVTPDSGYNGLDKVTVNAMPTGNMNAIEVSESGLVTASVGTSGYLATGTSKTHQLNTKAGTTITPTDSVQTVVNAGTYVTGDIIVEAAQTIDLDNEINNQDALIEQLSTILDSKASVDTSDATATAEDIAAGKTAYINGGKVTGTHECSGGGEPVEQVSVIVRTNGRNDLNCIYYCNGELEVYTIVAFFAETENTFSVDAGSIFIITSYYVGIDEPTDWTKVSDTAYKKVITSNEEVYVNG